MKLNKFDDPNYKILERGTSALSDVETLSIIISGNNAIEKSQAVLLEAENNLNNLSKMNYNDFKKMGLSHNQATRVIGCNEYAKRKSIQSFPDRIQIQCSKDVVDIMQPILADLAHEEFWILFLNRSNKILGKIKISQGGISGTVTDIRMIMKKGIEFLASGIICSHNHPSGNLNPSESDTKITQKIKEAGNLMDIQLMDHIIISEKDYYSFADNGLL